MFYRLRPRSELEMESWLNKLNKFRKSGLLSSFDENKCDVSVVIFDGELCLSYLSDILE